MKFLHISLFLFFVIPTLGEEKHIEVFVALCDNATQGIVKVNSRIGDGDVPADNLYWGCSDGLRSYFRKSSKWKLVKSEKDISHAVMERLHFSHTTLPEVTLTASAYRGSEMRKCLFDFFTAAADGESKKTKLVAFIGHNGLMDHRDFVFPEGDGNREAIVLGCISDAYCSPHLKKMNVKPVLMTRSLMYPGSFILHDALEGWLRGESKAQIRERAAKAYARNQKISVKGARSVFAE